MRHTTLAATALLAGCVSPVPLLPPPSGAAFPPPLPAPTSEAAAAPILAPRPDERAAAPPAWSPAPAPQSPQSPQDPRHIDQREPPRPDAGPRPFRHPLLATTAAVGFGHVAVRTRGTGLDDRAGARFLQIGIDGTSGAGLRLAATTSETDLFPGETMAAGSTTASAVADVLAYDAFPHWRWFTRDADFRAPVRGGVFVDKHDVEHPLAGVHRDWLAAGPRVQVEPTWRLWQDERGALELAGLLGGDLGVAWFRERFDGGGLRDVTGRWRAELGLALQLRLGRVRAELGYRLQHTTFGVTDSELFADAGRTELQAQQFFLGFGVTY